MTPHDERDAANDPRPGDVWERGDERRTVRKVVRGAPGHVVSVMYDYATRQGTGWGHRGTYVMLGANFRVGVSTMRLVVRGEP